MKKYDVVIVGAGPSGINCGIACQENGLSYVIIEKGLLVNSIYNFPVNMTFFSTSKKLEIGQVPFISHTDKPTRREALEYYRRIMEAYDLKIDFSTELISMVSDQGAYELKTSNNEYLAKNIILATGFYDSPRLLNVPGEQLAKVSHYYDDVHKFIRKDVVVVGAANSACDVALECWQKGANVTMIVRNETLYEKVKYWILPNIKNRIKEGSIKAYFSSNIISISESAVEIDAPEGRVTIKNDYVLAMTGYKPHMDWFRSLGINIHEETGEPELNLDTLESNIPRVYMAGVIVSGLHTSKLFIENTRDHAERIVKHIVNNE